MKIFIVIALVLFTSCDAQTSGKMTEKKYTNSLINETSPYLIQHAHNPVNWMPWGEKALAKAKKEDKPIIISIGYSACHWCHVMEHESFENLEIAKIMNDHFICIKVDREERPDIDHVYMDALHVITGRGGWPLNCFAFPNGDTFYGGTYFPTDNWKQTLLAVVDTYKNDRQKLITYSNQIKEGLVNNEMHFINTNEIPTKEYLDAIENAWRTNFDLKLGGNVRAPKFPMPNNYETLLLLSDKSDLKKLRFHTFNTLNKMATGGIYDQIGGGFARYSTDVNWLVPHFEKMLYDNAQLIGLYSNAYKISKHELYKRIVYETHTFINRELTGEIANIYSSLDADSEGVEGKYYIWSYDEIESILKENSKIFIDYYHIKKRGNWEGKTILTTAKQVEPKEITHLKTLLLKEREKRVKPGLDDKTLTSWNALLISGLVEAYKAFGDKTFKDKAEKIAQFILKNQIQKDGVLLRNYKNGKSNIPGFLEDYSLTIEAFIKLYQITFDEIYLSKAFELTRYTFTHFYDTETGFFFYTSDLQTDIRTRKKEVSDNVIPASNSVMAKNLFILGHYDSKPKYIEKSKNMLMKISKALLANPSFYSNWIQLYSWFVNPFYEIVVGGTEAEIILKEINKKYIPNTLIAKAYNESKLAITKNRNSTETQIFVCVNNTCKLPVTTIEQALKSLNDE